MVDQRMRQPGRFSARRVTQRKICGRVRGYSGGRILRARQYFVKFFATGRDSHPYFSGARRSIHCRLFQFIGPEKTGDDWIHCASSQFAEC